MAKCGGLILLTLLAIAADGVAAAHLAGITRPNLFVATAVLASLVVPGPGAVLWGAGCGLANDCLAHCPLGLHMVLCASLAGAASLAAPRRLSHSAALLMTFGLAFAGQALATAESLRLAENAPARGDLLSGAFLTGLSAAAIWAASALLASGFRRFAGVSPAAPGVAS